MTCGSSQERVDQTSPGRVELIARAIEGGQPTESDLMLAMTGGGSCEGTVDRTRLARRRPYDNVDAERHAQPRSGQWHRPPRAPPYRFLLRPQCARRRGFQLRRLGQACAGEDVGAAGGGAWSRRCVTRNSNSTYQPRCFV